MKAVILPSWLRRGLRWCLCSSPSWNSVSWRKRLGVSGPFCLWIDAEPAFPGAGFSLRGWEGRVPDGWQLWSGVAGAGAQHCCWAL